MKSFALSCEQQTIESELEKKSLQPGLSTEKGEYELSVAIPVQALFAIVSNADNKQEDEFVTPVYRIQNDSTYPVTVSTLSFKAGVSADGDDRIVVRKGDGNNPADFSGAKPSKPDEPVDISLALHVSNTIQTPDGKQETLVTTSPEFTTVNEKGEPISEKRPTGVSEWIPLKGGIGDVNFTQWFTSAGENDPMKIGRLLPSTQGNLTLDAKYSDSFDTTNRRGRFDLVLLFEMDRMVDIPMYEDLDGHVGVHYDAPDDRYVYQWNCYDWDNREYYVTVYEGTPTQKTGLISRKYCVRTDGIPGGKSTVTLMEGGIAPEDSRPLDDVRVTWHENGNNDYMTMSLSADEMQSYYASTQKCFYASVQVMTDVKGSEIPENPVPSDLFNLHFYNAIEKGPTSGDADKKWTLGTFDTYEQIGSDGKVDNSQRLQIQNVRHLRNVDKRPNPALSVKINYVEQHYWQSADIDFSTDKDAFKYCDEKYGWRPIASPFYVEGEERTNNFKGTYTGERLTPGSESGLEGKNHTISNIEIKPRSDNPQEEGHGLFFAIESGSKVRNLGMTDHEIQGRVGVGAFVGSTMGTIIECYNTGNVSGTSYVGGIFGASSGGSISNCYNTGSVTGTDNVGGIAGDASSCMVNTVFNAGVITAEGECVGGISGYKDGSDIKYAFNAASVTGVEYVAGIVGYATGTAVDSSFNSGLITGVEYVAGLVGYSRQRVSVGGVTTSYNSGEIQCANGVAGGIAGESRAAIKGCYNIGAVTGNGTIGAIAGRHRDGTVADAYYPSDLQMPPAFGDAGSGVIAESLLSSEMQNSNFKGAFEGNAGKWHMICDTDLIDGKLDSFGNLINESYPYPQLRMVNHIFPGGIAVDYPLLSAPSQERPTRGEAVAYTGVEQDGYALSWNYQASGSNKFRISLYVSPEDLLLQTYHIQRSDQDNSAWQISKNDELLTDDQARFVSGTADTANMLILLPEELDALTEKPEMQGVDYLRFQIEPVGEFAGPLSEDQFNPRFANAVVNVEQTLDHFEVALPRHLYNIRYDTDASYRQVADIALKPVETDETGYSQLDETTIKANYYHANEAEETAGADSNGWSPIMHFSGQYDAAGSDGESFSIENLYTYQQGERKDVGLFGSLSSAKINGLSLRHTLFTNLTGGALGSVAGAADENSEITNTFSQAELVSAGTVGLIAGSGMATVSNAFVTGSVTVSDAVGDLYIGGICGTGNVKDSYQSVIISAQLPDDFTQRVLVGGLTADGEVVNSYSLGEIQVNGPFEDPENPEEETMPVDWENLDVADENLNIEESDDLKLTLRLSDSSDENLSEEVPEQTTDDLHKPDVPEEKQDSESADLEERAVVHGITAQGSSENSFYTKGTIFLNGTALPDDADALSLRSMIDQSSFTSWDFVTLWGINDQTTPYLQKVTPVEFIKSLDLPDEELCEQDFCDSSDGSNCAHSNDCTVDGCVHPLHDTGVSEDLCQQTACDKTDCDHNETCENLDCQHYDHSIHDSEITGEVDQDKPVNLPAEILPDDEDDQDDGSIPPIEQDVLTPEKPPAKKEDQVEPDDQPQGEDSFE